MLRGFWNDMKEWFLETAKVLRREFGLVLSSPGTLLFFFALPLAYPIIYATIYNTEVTRDMPVAVVDNCRSAESREFVRHADATQAIKICGYASNMGEAKRWWEEKKCYGILEIPADYSRRTYRGEQGVINFYSDMSLLLRYRTFVAALTDLQIDVIQDITGEKISALGLESLAGDMKAPIASEAQMLGDTEQGFASFVIPGIVILILQQSMLLGICLLGGTSRERRSRNGGIDPQEVNAPVTATVWGRALAYTVFYFPMTIYILRFIPEIFNLPHYGNPVDYLLFILPMLLATAFLGQALNYFMKERESCFIFIVFSSVLFLFLSGLTWPRYAMSDLWVWIGNCIPAVWGVEGFIRINSNSATLPEVGTAFTAMWILALVYMLLAQRVTKYIRISNYGRNKELS